MTYLSLKGKHAATTHEEPTRQLAIITTGPPITRILCLCFSREQQQQEDGKESHALRSGCRKLEQEGMPMSATLYAWKMIEKVFCASD